MSTQHFGHSEPIDDWSRKMHDIMEEMLKRSFVDFRKTRPWNPAANLYETEGHFLLCVELAGVDGVEVDAQEEPRPAVRIVGVRSQPRPRECPPDVSIHMLEIDEGPFVRIVELPDRIDADNLETTFTKGYVWISIPKTTSR